MFLRTWNTFGGTTWNSGHASREMFGQLGDSFRFFCGSMGPNFVHALLYVVMGILNMLFGLFYLLQ